MHIDIAQEISAKAPFGAPKVTFAEVSSIQPGIWHEMPTTWGNHMYFQGGMTKRVKIKPFYLEMVEMLSGIESSAGLSE